MKTTVLNEIEALRRATLAGLRERYREAFGEDTPLRHREQLFRKIAWRLQALEQGDLPERARARARELASDAALRVIAPRGFFGTDESARLTVPNPQRNAGKQDRRIPLAGTVMEREFRGVKHRVEVLPDGFRYEGQRHKSLSSVARAITGTRWNGLAFFRLTPGSEPKASARKEKRPNGGN